MSYYDRQSITHIDGTPVFSTDEDKTAEREVADVIASAWECELHRFGELSPIDWYAVKYGRVIGLLELKNRSHESTRFPTVFLNVRKWLALQLGALGMGCPAMFFAKFTDGVFYIPINVVDATVHKIAGCSRHVKSLSDVEPVIEVPISDMARLV